MRFLLENYLEIVSVDEPEIAGLLPRELFELNGTIYLRMHSRDKDKWFQGAENRYDYSYSEVELYDILKKLRGHPRRLVQALIYFNNCHQGKGAVNAQTLKKLIGQDFGPPQLVL